MKALVQRVSEASVSVNGKIISEIGHGLLVLLGITHTDTQREVEWLANKLPALRIFHDDQGLMNRSVTDSHGEILVVSQFTLYADTRKGNRPSFNNAALPDHAEPLYNYMLKQLTAKLGPHRVKAGIFGAEMQIRLLNDGPVTIELQRESQPVN